MPHWGRPPGAHLGRQSGRRGGKWGGGDMRIEELGSESEDQFGLRDNRLHARQLTGPGDGGIWRRSVRENDAHEPASGPIDGADYDMYEDTNSTVAYAVQLAMQDNEDWLVETALGRIRRAHSEGHHNVTLSKRELEALERRRLQATPDPAVDNQRLSSPSSGRPAPTPPYPLDTSIHGAWARTTSASVSPQSSTTTLRSPLQPPFSGSLNRPPAHHAPPAIPRSRPDDHQRIPPYQAQLLRDPNHALGPPRALTRSGQRPYSNPLSQPPFLSNHAVLAPESGTYRHSESGGSSPQRRSPASSGDEIPMVEVLEHRVPSSPTRKAGRSSHQRISRS
ncbi:hypothetical protein BDV18DRAFT_135283 [Aspergillus unguis]